VLALAGPPPVGALGAGGSAMSRVRRLIAPVQPLPTRTRGVILVGLVTLILVPAVIALTPGLVASFVEACPFVF
jgi:hypothetical protein